MTQANQADLFGEGTYGNQQAGQLTPEEEARRRELAQRRAALEAEERRIASANLAARGRQNVGYGSSGRTFSEQVAGPGYQEGQGFVTAPGRNAGEFFSDIWNVPAQIATAPINATAGNMPGIGNTVRGVTGAVVRGPTEGIKEGVNNPGRTLATGGFNTLIAAGDSAVDSAATGVYRDLTGNSGSVDLPLTPRQLGRTAVTAGRAIGSAASDAARWIGDAAGNIGDALGFTPTTYQPAPLVGGAGGGAGTGSNAISSEAQRVINQAQQFGQQNAAMGAQYGQQAAAAQNRAAPQIQAPSSAQADAVYNAAMGFRGNDSGAAGIRAATADVSGAGRLEGFQSSNSEQGVSALYGYNPDATYNSANQLNNFFAENTAAGANAVAGFRPEQVQADAQSLRSFESDRSGIDRLNAFANDVQGPSQAQAFLRSQSDADKRMLLALSRSGRGGPGAAVNAQRQAISEGGAVTAETRGQGALLAAQEHDTYKARQLQALAQAGSLISAAEAQRLQGLSAAGALMSQADQQKLSALTAYGQLKATQDSQQLSARQSGGQLNLGADQARLGAISNAAQVQSAMDAQKLSAEQSAAQIRLSGSEINQRGQIAATNAELQASAQNLNALSLAGNISTTIRAQDISVLQSNLSSSLQTMSMNDQQTRFFSQMQQDRDFQSQNIAQQAGALGVSAQVAQQANDLAWNQFAYGQLSDQQKTQYNYDSLNAQQQNAAANRTLGAVGTGLSAIGSLFGGGGGGSGGGGGQIGGTMQTGQSLPQVPNMQLTMPSFQPYQPTAGTGTGTPMQLTMPQVGQGVGYEPYSNPVQIDY